MTAKVLYEELRPREFIERINQCPIAYLPLGTLEWHGLHLPLGADGLQSKGFFTELAEEIGGIVLPMLFLGPDPYFINEGTGYIGMDELSFDDGNAQQLEGTAYYVENDLFIKILEAILWNLSRAGFKIVVAHGHGPSTGTFANNIKNFEQKFGLKLFELWSLGETGDQGIQTDHAAYNETSLVMGLYPQLTDLNELSGDNKMTGISGTDPRNKATYEEGRRIIEKNVEAVGKKLKNELKKITWEKRDLNYSNIKLMFEK